MEKTILTWEEFNKDNTGLQESLKALLEKTNKKVPYKKSGLEKPNLADLNKDKKISGYEKARGMAIQKSMAKSKKSK